MMRHSIVCLLVAGSCAVIASASEAPEGGTGVYTTKYDGIDIDRILSNDRILTQYIKCLMGEGNCTNEGRELKKTLPDALATGCEKCSEKQKNQTDKVIKHLTKNRAKDWARLVNKYDPKGEYAKKYSPKLE